MTVHTSVSEIHELAPSGVANDTLCQHYT